MKFKYLKLVSVSVLNLAALFFVFIYESAIVIK